MLPILRRGPWLLGLLLCTSLPLLPILFGQSLWLRDIACFTFPMKAYVRERLLSGELPLWNPRLGLGRPVLGMVQPGVLYPGNLLLLLPVPLGLNLFFALHLPLCAAGARAWLRAWQVAELEAALGGALLGLSGYLVAVLAG